MKLRHERIGILAGIIAETLTDEKMVEIEDQDELTGLIRQIITEDLKVEDKLDEEVRDILNNHYDELQKQRIPYHHMFKLIKDKLVKERNLIL